MLVPTGFTYAKEWQEVGDWLGGNRGDGGLLEKGMPSSHGVACSRCGDVLAKQPASPSH